MKKNKNPVLLLYVMPALSVYLTFKFYPAISGIFYSMTNWNGLNKEYEFIFLDNFLELLKDKYFWNSILFTTKYAAIMVALANMLAILLAIIIENRRQTKSLYRTLFYLPNMVSMLIGGYMWNFIFTKVVYALTDDYGMKFLDHSWVGDPHYSFIAIIIVSLWSITGYLMIIYMAAIQGIPKEILEAADIEGASAWRSFLDIKLPLIRPAMTICIFWTLNVSFQVFDVIYSLTGGGPGRATQSVAINIYEEAFKGNIRYGYATAKSTLLFLIVALITFIQIKTMNKKEVEL